MIRGELAMETYFAYERALYLRLLSRRLRGNHNHSRPIRERFLLCTMFRLWNSNILSKVIGRGT